MDSLKKNNNNGTTGLSLFAASNYTKATRFLILLTLLLGFTFTQQVQSAAVIQKRSITLRETDQGNTIEQCRSNGICGWEVYDAATRDLKYYVAHTCKCPPTETCIRTEDNLQISAYIYQCKVVPTRKQKNKSNRPNVP